MSMELLLFIFRIVSGSDNYWRTCPSPLLSIATVQCRLCKEPVQVPFVLWTCRCPGNHAFGGAHADCPWRGFPMGRGSSGEKRSVFPAVINWYRSWRKSGIPPQDCPASVAVQVLPCRMFVGQLVLSENSQQLQSVTFSACCNASAVCAALVGLSVHLFVCLFIYYVEACKHCCTIAYAHSRSLQQQMQPA